MTHLCGPVRRIRAANPFRIGGDYLKSWRKATSGDEEGGVSRPDQVRPPKRCLSGRGNPAGLPLRRRPQLRLAIDSALLSCAPVYAGLPLSVKSDSTNSHSSNRL